MMLLQNITFTQLKQIVQKNPPIKSIKQDIQLLGLVFFFFWFTKTQLLFATSTVVS